MSKWADYVITCVDYDDNKISTVGVHVDNGDTLGDRKTWRRTEVVKELDNDKTFVTAIKDSNGKWTKGTEGGRASIQISRPTPWRCAVAQPYR